MKLVWMLFFTATVYFPGLAQPVVIKGIKTVTSFGEQQGNYYQLTLGDNRTFYVPTQYTVISQD